MTQKGRRRALVTFLATLTLATCTSSRPSPTSHIGYVRYYFIAPHDTGVFEVTAQPPSVCYSTQSYPARPIALVEESSGDVLAAYHPSRTQYCDRQLSADLASRLIADSSAFVVRWSPQPGQHVVETRLTLPGNS